MGIFKIIIFVYNVNRVIFKLLKLVHFEYQILVYLINQI